MFGEKIKEARISAGLTKDFVANSIGIQKTSLTNIENGNALVGDERVLEFAKLLNIDEEELLFLKSKTFIEKNKKDVEIGKKIRFYRKANGMTQADLAAKLGYTSSGAVCQVEHGNRGMSRALLLKCCEIFNVHIADILAPPESIGNQTRLYEDFLLIYSCKNKPSTYDAIASLITSAADEVRGLR